MPVDVGQAAGLYVHVPFCRTRCAYCAFYVTTRHADRVAAWLAAVATELGRYRNLSPRTVFFGGGTPSHLPPTALAELCAIVRAAVRPDAVREWTVECNPGTLDEAKFEVLREAGVTRLSLGAQAFDDAQLRRLGRTHTVDDVTRTVAAARAHGFDDLNLDLIACIPGVDESAWRATLDAAIALDVPHVSVYALSLDEGSALTRRAAHGRFALRQDVDQLAALHLAAERLAGAGLAQYEISNFARPGAACRHNIDCWRGEAYIGVGPAASSHLGLLRWTNVADIDRYIDALERDVPVPREEDALTPRLKALERVVFALRMNEGIPAAWGEPCVATLERLAREGLVARRATRWCLTARGRDLADAVGAEVLAAPDTRPADLGPRVCMERVSC